MKLNIVFTRMATACLLLVLTLAGKAQTDIDGDMMAKKLLCVGPMIGHSSWDHYWEGTLKRDNQNLGTVSSTTYSVMGNYGITNRLNLLFNVPYVTTNATAGTLHGMKGFQDLSLALKWRPFYQRVGGGRLSLIGLAGFSHRMSDYLADFLPLSIGLRSTVGTARIMGDYQYKKLFVTLSAAYMLRSDIVIDRDAYYTTELHLTNQVNMPDAANFNLRFGYRSPNTVVEAVVNNMTTLGGFDITRNNMPFPSNRMNMTSAGINLRYFFPHVPDLNFNAGADYVLAGRNVGQSLNVFGGVFWIFHFTHRAHTEYQFQN